MARFDMRIDPLWEVPLLIIGATHAASWADVGDTDIHLKMGTGEERIAYNNVESVSPHEWSLFFGIGHRLAYSGIGYVGSTENVVHIKLKHAQSFHVFLGIRHECSSFYVSLKDPDGFIAAVRPHL